MNYPFNCKNVLQAAAGTAVVLLVTGTASGQIATNAYDVASSYSGSGFTGNQGFGFGAWTLSTPGGGSYISGDATPNFGIWNGTGNSASSAIRPFNSSLTVGQTFSVQLQLNNLDSSANHNALQLLDGSGTVLFSYWHQGGDNANGHYTDAGVTDGAASGFAYDYQQLDLFSFTLNSATTYTFTDQKTGAHFDGTLSGTISQVEFLRDNESASNPSNGQDFKFNTLQITTSVPEPTALALGGLGCGLLLWGRRQKVTR